MTDKPKTCSTCAYKSDGLNTDIPDYCYCHDMSVERDGICGEWRGSLRDEPVNAPEMRLVENVADYGMVKILSGATRREPGVGREWSRDNLRSPPSRY